MYKPDKRLTSNLISVYIFVHTKHGEGWQTETNLPSKKLFAYFNCCETTRSWFHKNVTTIGWENCFKVSKNTFLKEIYWDNLNLYVSKYILRGTQKAVCQTKYIHNFHCALPLPQKHTFSGFNTASGRQHNIFRLKCSFSFGRNSSLKLVQSFNATLSVIPRFNLTLSGFVNQLDWIGM